jgi:ankyrin repeat protein/transcriptional regulator with XRE-family HTH domain
MSKEKEIAFLCKRLKELREKNNCTMNEMAQKLAVNGIAPNKSSISRVEAGKTSEKTLLETARKYCEAFGMSKEQTNQFLRGERIAVPDTSALLRNSQLIDELNKEYSKVIIPKVVVDELDNIKNTYSRSLGKKAWEVIRGISYGTRTILMDYTGDSEEENEDCKIIYIAQQASDIYHCKVDIITEDTDYSAYLKGNESVAALHLREYMATKQELINMSKLSKIDAYYADSYEKCDVPNAEEINAYLPDGNTLIISAVRNRKATFAQRKAKIEWLIAHGADKNKRDCSRRYFPPISHAVQMGDYDMFLFLLKECKVNPNVGSRNPFDVGKVRQKNEGNMPLMIASWEGRKEFVVALCEDERTSINQQDANGFTALMKACMNGHFADDRKKRTWDIRKILIEAGADQKIVDIDGKTAAEWVNEYHDSGPLKKQFKRECGNNSNRRDQKRGERW